jgi:hypothetical protein
LLLELCAPILRPWRRTQPATFPQRWPLPSNSLLLVARLLLSSISMFEISAVSRDLRRQLEPRLQRAGSRK